MDQFCYLRKYYRSILHEFMVFGTNGSIDLWQLIDNASVPYDAAKICQRFGRENNAKHIYLRDAINIFESRKSNK